MKARGSVCRSDRVRSLSMLGDFDDCLSHHFRGICETCTLSSQHVHSAINHWLAAMSMIDFLMFLDEGLGRSRDKLQLYMSNIA